MSLKTLNQYTVVPRYTLLVSLMMVASAWATSTTYKRENNKIENNKTSITKNNQITRHPL